MKILVTGGAGYIGCILVPRLLEHGHSVRVVDNLMFGGHGLLPYFLNPHFEFVKGDVRDKSTMTKALQDIDIIIHLAALVGYPVCKKFPRDAEEINYDAVAQLDQLRDRSRQVMIFAGTGSVYGEIGGEGICTEETPVRPITLYGVTKARSEKLLMEAGNTICFRFATAFGASPRLRLDLLINQFIYDAKVNRNLIVYEAHFKRTFIHVQDIARAFIFGVDHRHEMVGSIYNVGHESLNLSKEDLVLKLKDKLEFFVHFAEIGSDADKRNYEVSYEKVRRLGFETTVTLDEGISELIRAYDAIELRNPYSNV